MNSSPVIRPASLFTEPRGLAQAATVNSVWTDESLRATASKEWGRSRLPAEAAEQGLEVEERVVRDEAGCAGVPDARRCLPRSGVPGRGHQRRVHTGWLVRAAPGRGVRSARRR